MISGASEKELDIANARADIILALDNTATYESWLCIDTYIEQLENENKNLKQINEEHRKLNGELRKESNVLTEFEEWLEEDFKNETEHPTPQIYCNCYSCKIKVLDKLQELKEGKK